MVIELHGLTWKIEIVGRDVIQPIADAAEIGEAMGLTLFMESRILIRSGLQKALARQTVIHELAHAMIFAGKYHIEDEEAVCDFIGANLDTLLEKADLIMAEYMCVGEPLNFAG